MLDMANRAAIIFGMLSIILLIAMVFLLSSNAIYKQRAMEGEVLAKDISYLLKAMKIRCSVSYRSIAKFDKVCVAPLLTRNDFKEEEFKNMKNGEQGYIIIKNRGAKSYDSESFVLYKNREVADEGCVIPGRIDPQYTCRLNFNTFCEDGDVLEIKYNGTSIYVKNC